MRISERAGLCVCMLATLLGADISSSAAARADAPASDDAPNAKGGDAAAAFRSGLAAADAGDYAAALEAFRHAYALVPRYEVMFNIAQAFARLSCPREAAEHLARYLEEGQKEIPAPRAEEARALLARLSDEARQAGPEPVACSPGDPPARVIGTTPSDLPPATPPVHARALVADLALPPPARASDTSAPALQIGRDVTATSAPPSSRRKWIWSSAASALVLGGGAASLYAWNEVRYETWIRRDVELANERNATADVLLRQQANDQLLRSVRTMDWLTAGLALTATVAGVAAAVLFERSPVAGGRRRLLER